MSGFLGLFKSNKPQAPTSQPPQPQQNPQLQPQQQPPPQAPLRSQVIEEEAKSQAKPKLFQNMKTKSKQAQPPGPPEVRNEITTTEITSSFGTDAFKQQQLSMQMYNPDEPSLLDEPFQPQQQQLQPPAKITEQEKQEKLEAHDEFKARMDVDAIKKKPGGFNFLKKKEAQESVPLQSSQPSLPSSGQKDLSSVSIPENQDPITSWNTDDGTHNQQQQPSPSIKEEHQTSTPKQAEESQRQAEVHQATSLLEVPNQQVMEGESKQQPEETKRSSFLSNFKNKKQQQAKSEILTDQAYKGRYTALLQDLEDQERNLGSKMIQIFLEQLQSEKKVADLQTKIEELGSKLSQLTARQQEHIEKELFDQAEEIEQQIQKSKEEISKYEFQIQQLNVKTDRLQQEKEKVKTDEVPYCASMAEKLEEIEKTHRKYIEEYKLDQQQQLKKLQTQIEEENERVKITQIHIEIDMKHIDEEQDHINQALNNQTKEHREKLVELDSRKIELEEMIIELNRQLKEKQQDLDRVIEDLEEAEQQVMTVEQKFTQQLQKVDNKRQKLQEEMSQLEQERAQITKIENDYERKQRELENKAEVLSSQLQQMIEKKQNLSDRADRIPEQWHQEIMITERFKSANQNTYAAYCQMQLVERLLEDLQYRKSSGQSQLSDMIDQKKKIQDKLPKLIEDKQTLISNKNFKGAGAITNQIKEAQSLIEKLDQSIQENTKKEGELIQLIEEQEKIRLERKDNYDQLRRISEVQRYFVLELRLKEMNQLMQSNSNNNQLRQQVLDCLKLKNRFWKSNLRCKLFQGSTDHKLSNNLQNRNRQKNKIKQKLFRQTKCNKKWTNRSFNKMKG